MPRTVNPSPSASPAGLTTDPPILFVGDIQGCAEPLARLLERVRFDPARHVLIPLGDTVNRGPDAAGVLRLLRETKAQPILGNHERALLALDTTRPLPAWTRGPRSAYEQLQSAGLWEQSLGWMRTWPLWRRGPDWIAVHAGLHPLLPPERTEPEFLTTVRHCREDGTLPPEGTDESAAAAAGYQPWHGFYRGVETVLFGHWARQGLLWRERLRGLDTGCVYGRQLSGLWWPEDRLVQVEGVTA
jgi:bis(5'-nucleosyl)-tetraphosphatase (symmetrical)